MLLQRRKKDASISPMIPEQVVEEIKNRNEIVSVVEQYVTLDRKSSANFFGLCPFHKEDTPSFSVSPSKQIFYCFGCHKGGNVIQFIREIERISYPEALRFLADRAKITIPESDDEQWKQKTERNKRVQEMLLEAARWYYRTLIGEKGGPGRDYLNRRQIQSATAKKFGLGYAPDEWDSLLRHLRTLKFSEEELVECGLFKRTKQGSLIDLFRHRLIFPIFDVLGRVVAFGGRVIDDSMPKYINSPETSVYTKGRHLYAMNLARKSREGRLIVVEGYLDAIAMHQAGVDNAVASLGTALTEQQAMLLRKYTETVIIGFDADAAGQQAALRGLDILSSRDLTVSVLQVPDGKDPDEYIRRHGPERFHALIDKALPLLDYKLLSARRRFESEKGLDLLAYQDEACDILAREENAIVRELYAEKLAEMLKASQESVMSEIARRRSQPDQNKAHDQLRRQLQQQSEQLKLQQESNHDLANREELYLIAVLAANSDCWQQMEDKPVPDDFSHGTVRSLYLKLMPLLAQASLDTAQLMDLTSDLVIRGRLLSELLAKASMKLDEVIGHQDVVKTAGQWLIRMRIYQLRLRSQELDQRLSEETDPEQIRHLMEQRQEVSTRYSEMRETYNLNA